ncbi:MAG: MBL fold metallo-hydrolase, partial [Actinobacteria bacterium]|nr:MBL fold metallo-hydrolase [Actinomycetota bacterium]
MEETRFGRIRVIPGGNSSRFPACTALLIEDDIRTIIDPGCRKEKITEILGEGPVDRVINTHYHFDHIKNNYLFEDSEIWLNYRESPCFKDVINIARLGGIVEVYGEEKGEEWVEGLKDCAITNARPTPFKDIRWLLSSGRLDGTYKWGDEIDFGHTRAKVLPAPGHSLGCSYFFFPEERIVYTS